MTINDWKPGEYKVMSTVLNIRKEPRITPTNKVGQLKLGDKRAIYEFTIDDKHQTWGRVSGYDSAGKALWICAEEINRKNLELIGDLPAKSEGSKIRLYVDDILVYHQN